MKQPSKHSVSYWVRMLRENCGESQQSFSTRLDISIASLMNYEYGRLNNGTPKIWLAFLREARQQGSEFTENFREEFLASLNTNPDELMSLVIGE